MAKGILVVDTAPAEAGRETEYNDWYNDVHLVDILELAGFTAARRYRRLGDDASGSQPYRAIYEVEADDLQGAVAAMGAAVGKGEVRMSDVLAMDPPPSMVLYEEIFTA